MQADLTNPLAEDLDHILKYTSSLWEKLRDQSIFITGGTGFFGCWLLESFSWANIKLKLNAKAVVLTRDKNQFFKKCPHLANHPFLQFHEGDIRNFEFPEDHFSHVIHAATDANTQMNGIDASLVLDTITEGTQRTLEFANHCGAKRFLFTSSGAVYGKQPAHISHLNEDHPCLPDETKSAYATGKLKAEQLCNIYAEQYLFEIMIARCFAFVGPYFPLGNHYAVGDFIQNGLNSNPLLIKGDGSPYRSYLYAADLAIWLWTILFLGKSLYPYNVGSDQALTIGELAHRVAASFDSRPEVKILKPSNNTPAERYIPDIGRAQTELGLTQKISLDYALSSTIRWHRNKA